MRIFALLLLPIIVASLAVLLAVILAPMAFASDLKVSGSLEAVLFEPGERMQINVTILNRNSTAAVQAILGYQLKQKEETWQPVEDLRCGGLVEIPPLREKRFTCDYRLRNFFGDGEYKFYIRANIVNGTYTYTNLFFNITGANTSAAEVPVENLTQPAPEPITAGPRGEVVKARPAGVLPPHLFNITIVIFLMIISISLIRFYRKTRHIEA